MLKTTYAARLCGFFDNMPPVSETEFGDHKAVLRLEDPGQYLPFLRKGVKIDGLRFLGRPGSTLFHQAILGLRDSVGLLKPPIDSATARPGSVFTIPTPPEFDQQAKIAAEILPGQEDPLIIMRTEGGIFRLVRYCARNGGVFKDTVELLCLPQDYLRAAIDGTKVLVSMVYGSAQQHRLVGLSALNIRKDLTGQGKFSAHFEDVNFYWPPPIIRGRPEKRIIDSVGAAFVIWLPAFDSDLT